MKKNTPKTIAFVGGGTGGHIYPALNVARYIQREVSDVDILWIGEKSSLEQKLMHTERIDFYPICSEKLRRYFSLKTIIAPAKILVGIFQSLSILRRQKVTAIFSKGGYVSLPVCIAGWILRIPITLHESDSIAGLANRLCGRFATHIFLNFSEASRFFTPTKIRAVLPLVPENVLAHAMTEKRKTRDKEQKKILVSCGSQGSESIFDALVQNADSLGAFDFYIILGTKNTCYTQFESIENMHVLRFFEDQDTYLKKVSEMDAVITRGGGSLFEFAILGLPMLMIPHPYTGGNHQYHNAQVFVSYGNILLEQRDMDTQLVSSVEQITSREVQPMKTPQNVYENIKEYLTN